MWLCTHQPHNESPYQTASSPQQIYHAPPCTHTNHKCARPCKLACACAHIHTLTHTRTHTHTGGGGRRFSQDSRRFAQDRTIQTLNPHTLSQQNKRGKKVERLAQEEHANPPSHPSEEEGVGKNAYNICDKASGIQVHFCMAWKKARPITPCMPALLY